MLVGAFLAALVDRRQRLRKSFAADLIVAVDATERGPRLLDRGAHVDLARAVAFARSLCSHRAIACAREKQHAHGRGVMSSPVGLAMRRASNN